MKNIWGWIKNNPVRSMFLVPILLVATISISHVISWYNMANPYNWAVFLSIAIEVGAITALIAATNRIRGGIWFMFGVVTFIQMVGNIFYSYNEIDENSGLFKSWVELTGPLWDMMGSDSNDIPTMKRWLSLLTGGLLPIISLTSLHFFVKYEDPNSPKEDSIPQKEGDVSVDIEVREESDSPKEDNTPQKETLIDTKRVWDIVSKLKKEGKLPEPTKEDIDEEPTALANSQYRNEENLDSYEEIEHHHLIEESILEEDILDINNEEKKVDDSNEPSYLKDSKGVEIIKNFRNILKPKKNNGITRLD
jgi:hypothetical protein